MKWMLNIDIFRQTEELGVKTRKSQKTIKSQKGISIFSWKVNSTKTQ